MSFINVFFSYQDCVICLNFQCHKDGRKLNKLLYFFLIYNNIIKVDDTLQIIHNFLKVRFFFFSNDKHLFSVGQRGILKDILHFVCYIMTQRNKSMSHPTSSCTMYK